MSTTTERVAEAAFADARAHAAASSTETLFTAMHSMTHRIHSMRDKGGPTENLRRHRALLEQEIERRLLEARSTAAEATEAARLAVTLLDAAECQRPERSLRREWRRMARSVRVRVGAL